MVLSFRLFGSFQKDTLTYRFLAVRIYRKNDTQTTTIYFGTNGRGVFKSMNGGGNWNEVNAGLVSTNVADLAIDPITPTTLYAGVSNAGVFKSTNSGRNWVSVSTNLPHDHVNSLAIDPVTPTTLYVGIAADVFKSTDGGELWEVADTGLNGSFISSLAVDPAETTTIYVGTWGRGDGSGIGGVFKSTNSGASWDRVISNDIFILAIDPITPTTLYAGGLNSGVLKSTNGGASWNLVSTGLPEPGDTTRGYSSRVYTLAIDPVTPTTIYAGAVGPGSGGLFKSTNAGEIWNVTGLTNVGVTVFSLAIDPVTPTTIYAGTSSGVFVSTNGGESWDVIDNDLPNTTVETLAIDPIIPTNIYAGLWGNGVFVYQEVEDLPAEIDVQGNGQIIVNHDITPIVDDSTDFGNTISDSDIVSQTFFISNIGDLDLNLTGNPPITLAAGTHFTITTQPISNTIVGGSSTTFQIAFEPLEVGTFTDTISIANTDSDENPYTFVIAGMGMAGSQYHVFLPHICKNYVVFR